MSACDLRVLYEDRHIIAIVKPYGVLSQSDGTKPNIVDDIKDYLLSKGERGYVGVVHRLDVTTGGVMVFSKSERATALMSELVRNRALHKTYLAVVSGSMEKQDDALEDLLYHDKTKNKTYVVKRPRKGVKKALLNYTTLSTAVLNGTDTVSLLKINLQTGRTHQIRVQFASRRHPLVGDKKYGSTVQDKRIALWSYKIEFLHPITGDNIKVQADPEGDAFDLFVKNYGG